MSDLAQQYGKWALVTGASAGIGLEFARQLAAQRLNLVLVARRHDLLDQHARHLEAEFGVQVRTIARDLTADDAVESLYRELNGQEMSMVVMNAGIETTGHFTKTSLDDHIKLQRLNVDVPMRMANLFGKAMVQRGRGALVFVSSLFAYQGVPLMANYSASKAYLLSLGEALNVEMKPFGVDVLVVSPGLTDTDMPAHMPVNFNKMPITRSSPRSVVQAALASLGKKATVVPGVVNKFYAWENRLIPRSWPVKLFGALLGNAIKREARARYLHSAGSAQGR